MKKYIPICQKHIKNKFNNNCSRARKLKNYYPKISIKEMKYDIIYALRVENITKIEILEEWGYRKYYD